jgi:hypothetical protein
MTARRIGILIVLPVLLGTWGCQVKPKGSNGNNNNVQTQCHEVTNDCDRNADEDGDTISNGDEGCECNLDTDNDGIPNYMDRDSDGDGWNDEYEAGDAYTETPPVDTDGDGIPDFLDMDSDNDGVIDGDEDRNNDGKLGQCEDNPIPCTGPGTCANAEASCHPNLSICVDPICLDGETDPRLADTDGDGVPDGQESTFICNAATEEQEGRRPVQYVVHTQSLYKIAIEINAQYYPTDPANPGADEGAGAFDMTQPEHAFAGFVASRTAGDDDLGREVQDFIVLLQGLGNVTTLSAGSVTTSHALNEQHIGITLRIELGAAATPGNLRNQIIAAILGRAPGEFSFPTSQFPATSTVFAVTFMAQRAETGRTVFMGGVAVYDDWENKDLVHFHLADAAGGACLAGYADTTENECEQYLARVPTADLLWVVDASGSMNDDQQRLSRWPRTTGLTGVCAWWT